MSGRPMIMRAGLAITLALLLVIMLALGAACASGERRQIDVAAEYVRCSVNADYEDMGKVVAEEARPYCYAMAQAPPPPDSQLVEIVGETWEGDSLVFEVAYGEVSTYLRLSPATDDAPDEIRVETWGDAGTTAEGTLTVADEGDDRFVVTHVDGEPIEEVLAVGSGGF